MKIEELKNQLSKLLRHIAIVEEELEQVMSMDAILFQKTQIKNQFSKSVIKGELDC